ncbi:S-Ena type endospore appendage [Paenibacillus hodogayensis]|uniref:S-Ena type endospore appendage n=1 Tax=Paenibacillus hodogayensis TaxID=279208 RepID=A0ABV5VYP7_9BACL
MPSGPQESCLFPTDPPNVDCVDCSWFVEGKNGEEGGLLYVSSEIVYGSGSVTSNPGSSGKAELRFLFNQSVVQSLSLHPGDTIAFTVVGFNSIRVAGTGDGHMNGELHFQPRYSAM